MTQDYYQVGEKLRITIEGAVTETDGKRVEIAYVLPEATSGWAGIFTTSPNVKIQRLEPADGKPQPGDVWGDRDGLEWFASVKSLSLRLISSEGDSRDWGHVNHNRGPLTLLRRAGAEIVRYVLPAEQAPVGTPGEGTVPIGGVSPKSFVVHPDWNDGKPVGISTVEDSETFPGMTFVAYTDVRRPGSAAVMVDVDSDMQVTPWNFGDAL